MSLLYTYMYVYTTLLLPFDFDFVTAQTLCAANRPRPQENPQRLGERAASTTCCQVVPGQRHAVPYASVTTTTRTILPRSGICVNDAVTSSMLSPNGAKARMMSSWGRWEGSSSAMLARSWPLCSRKLVAQRGNVTASCCRA